MFEKSLYDLIRGLRNHKGQEREYVELSLQECRKEIKSQDADIKATALLKLTYLEMLGYDMSWASFNVLEVMSCSKFSQKRVGYLAAIQSFRSNTDVLVLAENQLQKDLMSGSVPTVSLTLAAIPHMLTSNMASSLIHSIIPLLNDGSPSLCKKAVVAVYRMALVHPAVLRPAWPKIKEMLLTENGDPSVIAAIVNTVCELGWRRPQDFLPLSPRLFEILTNGRNNWMAIKIIKLFATLTSLEQRLIRKLLPALTNVISTTPAMSLMYECINGIIEGGILDKLSGTVEGDEIARLCLSKLRKMLEADRDPNLKYVALLAFQRIAHSNLDLVIIHADVILECLNDADISIRMAAIDLCKRVSNAETIPLIVTRLLSQLLGVPEDVLDGFLRNVELKVGLSKYLFEQNTSVWDHSKSSAGFHSAEYLEHVIQTLIHLCSRNHYSDIDDFEWYLQVLVRLIHLCPRTSNPGQYSSQFASQAPSFAIGSQLLAIGVRVPSVRQEAVLLAEALIQLNSRDQLLPFQNNGNVGVLDGAGFLVGEYAELLCDPMGVLHSLTSQVSLQLPGHVLSTFVQALPKVLSAMYSKTQPLWSGTRQRTILSTFQAVILFLESVRLHSDLEVQERASEYLELLSVIKQAIKSHPLGSDVAPALLCRVLPCLHEAFPLNSVGPSALSRVAVSTELDSITTEFATGSIKVASHNPKPYCSFFSFYHSESPSVRAGHLTATETLDTYLGHRSGNSQHNRLRQFQQMQSDPFYLEEEPRGHRDSLHAIIMSSDKFGDFDIDDIPSMEPQLLFDGKLAKNRDLKSRKPRKNTVIVDESLELGEVSTENSYAEKVARDKLKSKNVLQVDSSGLGLVLLNEEVKPRHKQLPPALLDTSCLPTEEEEAALKEVERARKELRWAALQLQSPQYGSAEGGLVRKKKARKERKKTAKDHGKDSTVLSGQKSTGSAEVSDALLYGITKSPRQSESKSTNERKSKSGKTAGARSKEQLHPKRRKKTQHNNESSGTSTEKRTVSQSLG